MHLELRCVHDIRINVNVIQASSVLMFVRFTHQGISFNLEGCPQAIADGGWGQPEKELQTRWPLLTYGEGEGEVLSLINHSFGDGPLGSVYTTLHVYVLSLSSFYFFTKKQDLGEGNKETNAPTLLFPVCSLFARLRASLGSLAIFALLAIIGHCRGCLPIITVVICDAQRVSWRKAHAVERSEAKRSGVGFLE